jgi:plasmanylethanolamine desaturase
MGARPGGVVALELSSLAVCAGLSSALAVRWIGGLHDLPGRAAAVAGLLCGYLAADLASGLVHWFCDRFFEEDTPVVGRLLIHPFREHHRDPAGMTAHGWLELCGNSALALAPVLAAAVRLRLDAGLLASFAEGAMLAFAAAALATNVFHSWAHAPHVPRGVAWLQSAGLILSPRAHGRHHAPEHGGAYCVTSGWANRMTDGLGLFARLERGLVRLGVPAARPS